MKMRNITGMRDLSPNENLNWWQKYVHSKEHMQETNLAIHHTTNRTLQIWEHLCRVEANQEMAGQNIKYKTCYNSRRWWSYNLESLFYFWKLRNSITVSYSQKVMFVLQKCIIYYTKPNMRSRVILILTAGPVLLSPSWDVSNKKTVYNQYFSINEKRVYNQYFSIN